MDNLEHEGQAVRHITKLLAVLNHLELGSSTAHLKAAHTMSKRYMSHQQKLDFQTMLDLLGHGISL
jgi:hypothetical protein